MDTPDAIAITLNGEPRLLPRPMSVAELVAHLDLDGVRLACELDGAVVPRADREQARVEAGAVVEIVHFVGGG